MPAPWALGAPNPGTRAATDRGCRCPVLDNNHGQWAPRPPDGWWITENCPLHDPLTAAGDTSEPAP